MGNHWRRVRASRWNGPLLRVPGRTLVGGAAASALPSTRTRVVRVNRCRRHSLLLVGSNEGAVMFSMFSPVVDEFWHALFSGGEILSRSEAFAVAVNADLSEDRRVMVLQTLDGTVRAVLTPAVASSVGLSRVLQASQPLTESDFRQVLGEAGLKLYGADYLFYFLDADREALLREDPKPGVRRLAQDDAAVFAEFASSASEQDLDDAYVELEHWAVFGAFAQDRLVSVASAYPWGGARIADLGVLTLPEFRGQGHARAVVWALFRYAADQGYEPQYRCQLDNQASVALAAAAGLTQFGRWEAVFPDQAAD
jgi:RimJ/RimL family protein N-acetyltransferase